MYGNDDGAIEGPVRDKSDLEVWATEYTEISKMIRSMESDIDEMHGSIKQMSEKCDQLRTKREDIRNAIIGMIDPNAKQASSVHIASGRQNRAADRRFD